jgi:hypothetical protein
MSRASSSGSSSAGAHREIYLLTDAERATGTYSNRFLRLP